MADPEPIREVTDESFEQDVVEASSEVPVVVDFWADWCNPCKQLGPRLEELAEEAAGDWILAKVDVDQNKELAGEYDVRGIPAVKAFVDGEIVDEFTGLQSKEEIRSWTEGFRRRREAVEAFEAGDLDRAEASYEAILEEDPRDVEAKVGLARVAVARGDFEEARSALETISEGAENEAAESYARAWLAVESADARDPEALRDRLDEASDDVEAHYELGIQLAADEDYDEALEHLLEVVRLDREFRDDAGRRAMIRIFELVGPGTDRVREWRQKMGRVMY